VKERFEAESSEFSHPQWHAQTDRSQRPGCLFARHVLSLGDASSVRAVMGATARLGQEVRRAAGSKESRCRNSDAHGDGGASGTLPESFKEPQAFTAFDQARALTVELQHRRKPPDTMSTSGGVGGRRGQPHLQPVVVGMLRTRFSDRMPSELSRIRQRNFSGSPRRSRPTKLMPGNRLATDFCFGHVTQSNLSSLPTLPTCPGKFLLLLLRKNRISDCCPPRRTPPPRKVHDNS
jgi:hypothetical protein